MFWFLWIALLLIFFIVPWTWGASRWGAPWPSYYRRRGRPDLAARRQAELNAEAEAEAAGWGIWANILWVIWLALLVWLIVMLFV